MEPLAVDELFRLLRRSLILIGVASTIVYRSVFLRFDLLMGLESLSVSLRRRFLEVDLTTEYWLSSNRKSLIGVTVCGAFLVELGVRREEDGVRDFLLGVFRDGGEDVDFLGVVLLFWGVGDLLLVLDLKAKEERVYEYFVLLHKNVVLFTLNRTFFVPNPSLFIVQNSWRMILE